MYTKEFFDLQHAKSYLQGGIIRYRGNPVYVQNVASGRTPADFLITYHELKDVREGNYPKLGNFPDKAFDLNPVPLGMLNLGEGSVGYVSRMPIRQWKVGMTATNTKLIRVFTGDLIMDLRRQMFSLNMRDAILGNYPSLNTVLHGGRGAAFSRRFAVKANKLYYRTRGRVGRIVNKLPKLDDNFFFLREVLMEDLHG